MYNTMALVEVQPFLVSFLGTCASCMGTGGSVWTVGGVKSSERVDTGGDGGRWEGGHRW